MTEGRWALRRRVRRRLPPHVGHRRHAEALGQSDVVDGDCLGFVEAADAVLDVALVDVAFVGQWVGEDVDDAERLLAGELDGVEPALAAVDSIGAEKPKWRASV